MDDSDREIFLDVLADVCARFNWVVHAYCLMTNHCHVLIETPDANLSQGMRQLNGVYTQSFNRRHKRVGHVFQGRYKAILVQKESYLLELARYIVLNPVRAQMVRAAKDWPWSSYRATAGYKEPVKALRVDWILSAFASRKSTAMERYQKFVAEGKNQPKPWDLLRNQIYLGDDAFINKMQNMIDDDADLREIPSAQKWRVAKPLSYYDKKYLDRNDAIVNAFASGGYSMTVIGEYFGVHYSKVSRIVKARSKT